MPYSKIDELPEEVRNVLPEHAQHIFMESYNSAWDQYQSPDSRRGDASREETAMKVAWSAVKAKYEKNESSGKWHKK